jgi:chromosome segregation ATPase
MANSMEGVAWTETRAKVQKWIEDGQYLIGLIPALVEENERLRTSLDSSEKEFERLRQEVALLRGESEQYRTEREDVADALNKFMNDMLQLVNEVAQKFRTPQRKSPFEREGTHRPVAS